MRRKERVGRLNLFCCLVYFLRSSKITAQILRVWFATEMGESLIPNRFVDVFQGRAPRTVLAKHYTGKRLLRLKRIYDKADLKVL